jgi:carbon storage regulator
LTVITQQATKARRDLMLVLSRRGREKILIPLHSVEVEVLEIRGGYVRLGITAPASVAVYRKELWDRMQQGAGAKDKDCKAFVRETHLPLPRYQDSVAARVAAAVYKFFGVPPKLDVELCDVELAAAERALGAPLPETYRAFLRRFGEGSMGGLYFFGLPRDNNMWMDVVLQNRLGGPDQLCGFVNFGQNREGRSFWFDTSQIDAEGECPVLTMAPDGAMTVVARGFVDFLGQSAGQLTALEVT